LLQTFEKKKAMNKLSIPLLLDMGDILQAAGVAVPEAAPLGPDGAPLLPGAPGCVYELAAVLIHKGTSASHGHYGENYGVRDACPSSCVWCSCTRTAHCWDCAVLLHDACLLYTAEWSG
jgi:hypothetical protein